MRATGSVRSGVQVLTTALLLLYCCFTTALLGYSVVDRGPDILVS